jgi:acyl-coenzyme A synthetase/AMP-(fatty) acid ligase
MEGADMMDSQSNIIQTIPRLLEQYRESASPALLCGDEVLSYRALLADARKIASGIRARGVRKGDRVVLTVKRGTDYVRAWLGVLYAGAVQVTFHDGWPEHLLASAAEDCRPSLFLDGADVRELLASPDPPEDCGIPAELLGEDPFQIVYTSGSTGTPKGVVTSHLSLMSYIQAYAEMMDISAEDRLGCQAPLDYIAAIRDEVVDTAALSIQLLTDLLEAVPDRVAERFKIKDTSLRGPELLDAVCAGRGFLMKGGVYDTERACQVILDEFRGGKLGRITLEAPRQEEEKAPDEEANDEQAGG